MKSGLPAFVTAGRGGGPDGIEFLAADLAGQGIFGSQRCSLVITALMLLVAVDLIEIRASRVIHWIVVLIAFVRFRPVEFVCARSLVNQPLLYQVE